MLQVICLKMPKQATALIVTDDSIYIGKEYAQQSEWLTDSE